jgi:hypothetical protein
LLGLAEVVETEVKRQIVEAGMEVADKARGAVVCGSTASART